MRKVDVNCDLGEGCGSDADLMRFISSANIACGAHAGDEKTMLQTVDLAVKYGVSIGAHPGYPDEENFGRLETGLEPGEIHRIVFEQVSRLQAIAASRSALLHHVKPHGALYNRSAKDLPTAQAIADAVRSADPRLVLFGLSGSESIRAAAEAGLRTASETFADRTYQPDGSLTPRSHPNALIENDEAAIAQAMQMVSSGTVTALSGEELRVDCDTICIHGDGVRAVEFANQIRIAFEENGISVRPPYY